MGSQSGLTRSKTVGTESLSHPVSLKSARQEQVPPMPVSSQNPSIVSLQQGVRSQSFPLDMSGGSNAEGPSDVRPHKTVEALDSSHGRKPSVASMNRPLEEIGSTTLYRPFRPSRAGSPAKQQTRSNQSSPSRALSRSGDQKGRILNIVPPVSIPSRSNEYNVNGLHYTPTESTSSRESSGSDANSHSSRSSPPLSESAFHTSRKPSDTNQIKGLMKDTQSTVSDVVVREEPLRSHRVVPPSFSRPLYPRLVNPTPLEAVTQPPESPMDPTMGGGHYSSIQSPTDQYPPDRPLQKTCQTSPPHAQTASQLSNPAATLALERPLAPLVQPPSSSSPVRRTTATNKGKCRGCNEMITGKSVSSADGRLTGRYHKHCFVCRTCKEPFQTADFYVIGNHPYCSRHYHQLNGSLCRTCDRGIEGQYVETELKQKFHPSCFTCQVGMTVQHSACRILSTDNLTGLSQNP